MGEFSALGPALVLWRCVCVEEDAAIASLCVEVSSSVVLHYRGGGH